MERKRKQQHGFTLLELLMVVIIVGILASLALPGYIRSAERSRGSEAQTYLGQLKGAAQRFCMQTDGAVALGAFNQLDVDDLQLNDPTGFAARWAIPVPAVTCTPTYTFSATATRVGTSPCVGSTITLTYPAASGSEFTFAWAGPCA